MRLKELRIEKKMTVQQLADAAGLSDTRNYRTRYDKTRRQGKGVLAGANVIMPNLSPTAVRKKYMLYDNKICTEDSTSECRNCLQARMKSIGYEVTITRGDYSE